MAAAKALLQPHWIAVLYMALHAPAEALKWLEIATEERCSWILFAPEDPKFADFRSEIRFQHVVDATNPSRVLSGTI